MHFSQTIRTRTVAAALIGAAAVLPTVAATQREIPPAFGPYINLTAKDFAAAATFKSSDRIVGTYYFYWYNAPTKEHIVNPEDGSDGLTDHPPSLDSFSYKSVSWHKKQLADMSDAGIDLLLATFWGAPSERSAKAALYWSYAGLEPLVQAREELLREGRQPPRLGLFYDTSTLQYNEWGEHIDLTTDYGKRWFYATIRDFYSAIPPRHWAMMDNKPIVLMYASAFAKKHDQAFVDFTREQFRREFGGRELYLVPQDSWQARGDNVCAWGGACGLRNPGIGELGPGYNDSAVFGRKPMIVNREGGKFYEANWTRFLRRPSNFVMIETWSEFHEGTEICESREYGRQYIELTRKYADRFKKGWAPPWPRGRFTGANTVSVAAGESKESGVRFIPFEDSGATPSRVDGRDCWSAKPIRSASAYLYFQMDDSFKWKTLMDATIEIEYRDSAAGLLGIEFDGSDRDAPVHGAYTRTEKIALRGDRAWKTARFKLSGACFANGQNGGADFRLVAEAAGISMQRVTVVRE